MTTPHVPTHRRTLSGKLIPIVEQPDVEVPAKVPSRAAHRRAFARLTPDSVIALHNDPGDEAALEEWRTLAVDETTRAPLNTRERKRAAARDMARKAKRGRVRAARSTIALQAQTARPSRGFLRLLLANANRQAEQARLDAAMAAHPAGKGLAA